MVQTQLRGHLVFNLSSSPRDLLSSNNRASSGIQAPGTRISATLPTEVEGEKWAKQEVEQ